jgi:rhamnosyltransferase
MTTHQQDLGAIVVSFNPDLAVTLALIQGLEANACPYLVIDNGSHNQAALAEAVAGQPLCREWLALPQNIGLSQALNLGLERMAQHGWTQVLLFDQDSAIEAGFCQGMQQAWREAEALAPGRTAAIGPRLQDPRSARQVPFRRFDSLLPRPERRVAGQAHLFETGFLITSGCLIDVRALRDIGLMKSDYFIDNIDLEWCFRAVHRGYRLYGTDHARLLHRIGEDSDSLLVRKGLMVQHSPLRFYYSSRNRLDLYRRAHAPWRWKLRDLPRFALKTAAMLLLSPQRWDYMKNLLKAVRDSRTLS